LGSAGNAINARGEVTGASGAGPDNFSHAFFWNQRTGLTDLGTPPGYLSSPATGINASGKVVGSLDPASGNPVAFLWTEKRGFETLGTLPQAIFSGANGINDRGEVVGDAGNPDGFDHPFLWTQEEGMRDLGTLGGQTATARAINDSSQVTGYSEFSGLSGVFHAYVWNKIDGMVDIGTLPEDESSFGYAINQLGQVVGESDPPCCDATYVSRAFAWDKRIGMLDLGFLPGGNSSVALGINVFGEVVGYGDYQNSDGMTHAFIWTYQKGMRDLNSLIAPNSGLVLSVATGINVEGQITGHGMINGEEHAFLLTPRLLGRF
jgi:probable HAF family extracellular repeat protein